jgi:methyltransferase (TIGR00027 family)
MKENRASSTAMEVAKARAAHQVLDGEPLILADPVALRLVGQQAMEAIRADASLRADPRFAAFRAHIVLRNRYAEDCLREAAGRDVRQYVLMGAGYDTFAYRQPPWAAGLRIFEVDHPATQAAKREARLGWSLAPGELAFCGAEFRIRIAERRTAASGIQLYAAGVFLVSGRSGLSRGKGRRGFI